MYKLEFIWRCSKQRRRPLLFSCVCTVNDSISPTALENVQELLRRNQSAKETEGAYLCIWASCAQHLSLSPLHKIPPAVVQALSCGRLHPNTGPPLVVGRSCGGWCGQCMLLGPSVVWPRMFSVTTLLHVQFTDFPPDMTDCCRSCWFDDPVNGLARRSPARNRKQAAAHKAATKEATYAVVDRAAVDKEAADRANADKAAADISAGDKACADKACADKAA